MAKRDFLSLLDFSPEELEYLIHRGRKFRQMHEDGQIYQPLVGKVGALILQMNSTRTRVAFEAGLAQMGGHCIQIGNSGSQLSRGEPIEDMARVLSEMALLDERLSLFALGVLPERHLLVQAPSRPSCRPIIRTYPP